MDDACFADRRSLVCVFDDLAVLAEVALKTRKGSVAEVDAEQRNWIPILAALRDAETTEQESARYE